MFLISMQDKLSDKIEALLKKSDEPLQTNEIVDKVSDTRIKVLYRLNLLRAESRIMGKVVGSGKKAWIWWRANAFRK